jgi:hypothetical protein
MVVVALSPSTKRPRQLGTLVVLTTQDYDKVPEGHVTIAQRFIAGDNFVKTTTVPDFWARFVE